MTQEKKFYYLCEGCTQHVVDADVPKVGITVFCQNPVCQRQQNTKPENWIARED